MSNTSFRSVRAELKEALRPLLKRADDPRKTFCPRAVALECFRHHRKSVRQLYLRASRDARTEDRADVFADAVIGLSREAGEDEPQEHEGHALSNILATLIYIDVDDDSQTWDGFERLCISYVPCIRPICDSDLPIDHNKIVECFGNDQCMSFWSMQFFFCPFVLQKDRSLTRSEECRAPYLSDPPEPLGQGSSGTVYQVRLAKGHLESQKYRNIDGFKLARKDFAIEEGEENTEGEWTVMKEFLRSTVKNDNIMGTLASLRQGPTFSIFYELARCDLWKYMETGIDGKGSPPNYFAAKLKVFQQMANIAGALEHLHGGLRIDGYSQFSCYHLDLKPENILVVDDSTRGEMFKIADFSISHIGTGNNEYNFHKIFSKIGANSSILGSIRDQSTTSKLGHNATCISPEAYDEARRVTSRSDIWAFACVMAMIITWLKLGWKGLNDFENERCAKGNKSDYFFVCGVPSRVNRSEYTINVFEDGHTVQKAVKVNPGVVSWFSEASGPLQRSKGTEEGELYRKVWKDLLKKELLREDPKDRTMKMKDVTTKLFYYYNDALQSQESRRETRSLSLSESHVAKPMSSFDDDSTESSVRTTKWWSRTVSWPNRNQLQDEASKTSEHGIYLKLKSVGSRVQKCMATPRGTPLDLAHLAFFGPDRITVFAANLGSESATAISKGVTINKEKSQTWKACCLSRSHLCAVRASDEQYCLLFRLSSLNSEDPSMLRIDGSLRLTNMAIAPDSTVVAFICEEHKNHAIHKTVKFADVLDETHIQGVESTIDLEDCDVEDIQFSDDGQSLIIVQKQDGESTLVVTGWDVPRRKKTRSFRVTHDGTNEIRRSLFTSIAFFNNISHLLIITENSSAQSYDLQDSSCHRIPQHLQDFNIRLALIPETDDTILWISRPEKQSTLQICETPYNVRGQNHKVGRVVNVRAKKLQDFSADTDCALLLPSMPNGSPPGRRLLVVHHKGELEILPLDL